VTQASPKSRSILRHPSRVTKTSYTKRRTSTGKTKKELDTEQIQNTGVLATTAKIRGAKNHVLEKVEEKGRDVRDLHNSMERQRRVDLKNAFDALKMCVPEIADSDRASKLMILDKAAEFCQSLLRKETSLTTEREKEKRRNTLMRRKLTLLKTQSKTSLSKCTRQILQ